MPESQVFLDGPRGPVQVETTMAALPWSPDTTITYSTDTKTGKTVIEIKGSRRDSSSRWAQPEENKNVASSSTKAYSVSSDDFSKPILIEATSVVDTDGRLTFYGPVEGYSNHGAGEIVASFLSARIAEYHVVPVVEEDKQGAYEFNVEFRDGSSRTVRADQVYYAKGTEKTNGLFTLITELRGSGEGAKRTEFTGTDDLVATITRVTEASVPAQATPADVQDAKTSA